MSVNDAPGRGLYGCQGHVGRNFKEEHYTLLHTEYESSGPCGFGEFFCFKHCKSMGAICCHGNHSSVPTWPNISPTSMMLLIKFDCNWLPTC